jgi:hypothetical protein
MRLILPIVLLLLSGFMLKGQTIIEPEEGAVSFVTSQNVYVKFKSTQNIAVGDTLYFSQAGVPVPSLVVTNLSSISCVCIPITSKQFAVSDKIYTKQKIKTVPEQKIAEKPAQPVIVPPPVTRNVAATVDSAARQKPKQDISGRVSLSSYSDFSNTPAGNSQRMRYTFSLNARNIANTKLSAETYISFVHKSGEWSKVQADIWNALKIYNLALVYEFNDKYKLWFGRRINPKISNMGACDGLQFEMKFHSISVGVLAGSRPDYGDYSLNFNLVQFGAYISHDYPGKNGMMQTALAFVEQMNHSATDRRFAYLQHSNTLVKNLNFFGTVEVDLYKYDTLNKKPAGTFNLTNLYLSLRWRVIKQLSLTGSYSARENVIYYETYKSTLDQIINPEVLQGYMFSVTYNPINYLSVGARAGYRFRKSDPKPSKNLYAYATYSRIPVLEISATLSATLLETSYISGRIYSLTMSRDLVRGRLFAGLGYHYVDYKYFSTDSKIPQNMAEASLNWIIYKKLSLSLNYEGTFEKINQFNRLYINVTQRF